MSTRGDMQAAKGNGPQLQPWPLLAWTPELGVITEDRQIRVSQILHMRDASMSYGDIAQQLGTTVPHVAQALSYLASTQMHSHE